MKKVIGFSAAILPAWLMALSASAATLDEGVYTEEQAGQGEAYYEESCAQCHNAEFYADALSNRIGQPMAYLFEQVVTTMPQNAPGSLPDEEYEDILAHILQLLEFPAGDQELRYSDGSMHDAEIVAPD